MNVRWASLVGTTLVTMGLLASCASTNLMSTWVDPQVKGKKLQSVMVMGIAKNDAVRRVYEDSFVAEFSKRGVSAVPSYRFFPDPAAIKSEAVEPVLQQQNIKELLITRLVDKKTVTSYVPPTTQVMGAYPSYYPGYYGSWSGYYGYGYSAVSTPGYTYDTEYVNLETNVYDTTTGKLIWSGITETELGSNIDPQIQEFIQVIASSMKSNGLL